MAGADREKPSGSRCDEVLRDVWLFLDDEMDLENRAAVQRHLDDCSPCLVEAGIDEKLKHGWRPCPRRCARTTEARCR